MASACALRAQGGAPARSRTGRPPAATRPRRPARAPVQVSGHRHAVCYKQAQRKVSEQRLKKFDGLCRERACTPGYSLPGGIEDRVSLKMDSARLPALRVLEVDIPCTLSLRLAWVARGGRRAGQGGRLARAHWRGRDAARCAPRPAPSRPPCEHVWTLCTLAVRLPATHCRSLLARIG